MKTTQPGDLRSAAKGVPGYTKSRPCAGIKITSLYTVHKRGDTQSNSSRPQMKAEWFEVQWKGRELKATPRSKRSRVLNATNNRGHFEPHLQSLSTECDLLGIRTLLQSDLPGGSRWGEEESRPMCGCMAVIMWEKDWSGQGG